MIRGLTLLLAAGVVCLIVISDHPLSPTALLLRPEQAPVAPQPRARLTSLATDSPVHPGVSQALARPRAAAARRLRTDPYTAKPAEADYVDNAAAGLSHAGRREARQQRLRTQKLVEQETAGTVGKQFDDVYARKHWFENADANDDAKPELDIPKLQAEPVDAIPTTPHLEDMAAKKLDREAGLAHPVVADKSTGMKGALKMAADGDVEKASSSERFFSIKEAQGDHDKAIKLFKADIADPVDRAVGDLANSKHGGAGRAPATGRRKGLSESDLKLLEDARMRQAQDAGIPLEGNFPSERQMSAIKTPKVGGKTPLLAVSGGLEAKEEPKAVDNPIGVASAAKILKDAELFDESKNGDAMDKWKDAAKGSGPAILDAIKDDVSTYSPFPKTSLSERMEVQDVWDRARANTKPAGKLDGDAAETKDTVENAEAQAESQAYLAANEAAAVDSYDVSFPNPDMMAKGGGKKMPAQALANKGRHVVAMRGQALAAGTRGRALWGQARARGGHKAALHSRVQALAELELHKSKSRTEKSAVEAALDDERSAKQEVQRLQAKVEVAKGEAKEAAKLKGFTSKAASAARARVTKYQLAILREGGVAQEARKMAGELAGNAGMPSVGRTRAGNAAFWKDQAREKQKREARHHALRQVEDAAANDRSRGALVMRLEDKAARLRKELDITELQAHSAKQRGHDEADVRRMVDSDGGSVGGSLGSAFGDAKVPKSQNLLQQQLEGEDDEDDEDLVMC